MFVRILLFLVLLLIAVSASAAVDTRDKRASAASVGTSYPDILPNPDSTIDAADRAHIAGEYSGLAAGGPPPPGDSGDETVVIGIKIIVE